MSNNVIFYTQIASIIGFIVSLFVLYRVLINQKDATIQLLKEKIEFISEKLDAAEKQSPDVLVERLTKREAALKSELEQLMNEQNSNQIFIAELKTKLESTQETFSIVESEVERAHVKIVKRRESIKAAAFIKKLYDYKCQVCNLDMNGIAEAAHIIPFTRLGDSAPLLSNVLCLCPNHHQMFDQGLFSINDDLSLLGIEGSLTISPKHQISKESLKYHREHIYKLA